MSNSIDSRITVSNALLRGLDTQLHSNAAVEETQGASFANILQGILGNANSTDATAHNYIGTMMTGDYDPDLVMVSSTKAELALQLVVEVRNRAVEAYSEIMRMQV